VSALARLLPSRNTPGLEVPADVSKRLERGRERAQQLAPKRNECLRFWRGDQYVHLSESNQLVTQPTRTSVQGNGKPPHRARTVWNRLTDPVEALVSMSTSRIPGYQVNPTNLDPQTQSAAALGSKVARWGYDKWRLRTVTERVIRYAIIADEGFAWPYWDSSYGDPVGDGIGTGEICVRVFGPNQVYWEPGVRFDESRWHAVEYAEPVDQTVQREGYFGGELTADADASDALGALKPGKTNLCLVTEYLERPSQRNPKGSRLIVANKRVICPPEPYPLLDSEGKPVDEPVLHKLEGIIDPDNDRDLGSGPPGIGPDPHGERLHEQDAGVEEPHAPAAVDREATARCARRTHRRARRAASTSSARARSLRR
jgi:hypothetical protein